jgi:hypothetical protein
MPKWYTQDVYKRWETYIPTHLGGLGVPVDLDWMDHEQNLLYASSSIALRYRLIPSQTKFLNEEVWERGIMFNQVREILSPNIRVLNRVEAFKEMSESMNSTKYSAPIGAKAVMRQIYKSKVDIERPVAVLGTKESPYGEIFSENFSKRGAATVQWPRKEFQKINRYTKKVYMDLMCMKDEVIRNYARDYIPPVGQYVDREELQAMLGIGFETTKLTFGIIFYDGEQGQFDPTHV